MAQYYKQYFGRSVYSFTVEGYNFSDLFICLDTGNGTIGSKQKQWLENILKKEEDKHRYYIIFTHTNIWNRDNSQAPTGNLSIEETLYLTDIFDKYKVNLCISGHDHFREVVQFKNTTYITLDAIRDECKNASYVSICCSSKQITHTFHDIK